MKTQKENRGTLQVDVKLTKAEFGSTVPLMGAVNSTALTIAGKSYPPKSLQFLTFAGTFDESDFSYCGEYRFNAGEFPDADAKDLSGLPKLVAGRKKTGVTSDVI